MTTPAYPSGQNTFIPNFEASGRLSVEYALNPKKFPLPDYCHYQNVDQTKGFYHVLTTEQAGRILDTTGRDFMWPDGSVANLGHDGAESFKFEPYECVRYQFSTTFGYLTLEQAQLDIERQHQDIMAQRAMTLRTQKVATLVQTSGNWPTTNTIDVTSISGVTGRWDASTNTRQDIKRSINYAITTIADQTLAVVQPDDLYLVMGPATAQAISVTSEITDLIKQQPGAESYLIGEGKYMNRYGLPDKLYGINVVVDETRKVTSRKGATDARSAVWAGATPAIVAKPQSLSTPSSSPFSTVTLFIYQGDDMAVESLDDPNNRRKTMRVVDHYDEIMVSGISGFLFQNAIA